LRRRGGGAGSRGADACDVADRIVVNAGDQPERQRRPGLGDREDEFVAGTLLGLRVYVWGGRLSGWKRIRTGLSSTSGELTWNGTSATGRALDDGTYQVTVCYKDPGRLLPPRGVPRPGAAEAGVRRPPWRSTGCATNPHVVRVERLALFTDSTGSFQHGDRVPLVVSADRGQAGISLERDCEVSEDEQMVPSRKGSITIPFGNPPGLYHGVAGDPAGDVFRATDRGALGRAARPPEPHTALVVWPYLTWRAYNAYDADLNGIPDSWYQFWPQRRVSLKGPLLRDGLEDDHQGGAAVLALALLALRPNAADHRRRARPPVALDSASLPAR
jgi:hypothetical protein